MNEKQHWINKLQLDRHPDGGYFKEIYRSTDKVKKTPLDTYEDEKVAATSIYYLLESGLKSFCHKLKSDELWYYHLGSPLSIYIINQNGEFETHILGTEVEHELTVLIPKNSWFGARVIGEDGFTLTSCAVAPGFEWGDLEMADRNELIQMFPQHKDMIIKYTLTDLP